MGAGQLGMAMYWDRTLEFSDVKFLWKSQKLQYGFECAFAQNMVGFLYTYIYMGVCVCKGYLFIDLILQFGVANVKSNLAALNPPPTVGKDEVPRRGTNMIPAWPGGSTCARIELEKPFSSGAYQVQAQLSHRGYQGSDPHTATTLWIEDIQDTSFRVCVRQTGIAGAGAHESVMVEWVAYQQVPAAQTGEVRFGKWFANPKCANVKFAKPFATTIPNILITQGHRMWYLENKNPSEFSCN
jgi:hypothetical protein